MKLDKLDVLLYFKFFLTEPPSEHITPSCSQTPNAQDSPPHTGERLDVEIDINEFLEDGTQADDRTSQPIYIVYNYSRDLQSSDRMTKRSKTSCRSLSGLRRIARWSEGIRGSV